MSPLEGFAREVGGEEDRHSAWNSLEARNFEPSEVAANQVRVLLDGGAKHNVYYSSKIPQGAVKKQVDLAHGSKVGYVQDGYVALIGESTTLEQAKMPSIISSGRLIQYGANMLWSQEGAALSLPGGKGFKYQF